MSPDILNLSFYRASLYEMTTTTSEWREEDDLLYVTSTNWIFVDTQQAAQRAAVIRRMKQPLLRGWGRGVVHAPAQVFIPDDH